MPSTFGTDANNDIFVTSAGNLSFLSGIEAIQQACLNATKAQLGEMVLNADNGLPNFQTIWVGSPNFAIYENFLRSTILSISGVLAVSDIQLSVRDNTLFYTATIQTSFGESVLNG